jgi:hypothetical protein
MNCETRIHKGYAEWELAKERGHEIPLIFGKYQFIYSSKKGKISLILLKKYFCGIDTWEIYCLKGDLFEDVERFDTKEEAEKRIREILD